MPYKRYDIKNRYNHRGRRSNDPVVFKTVMLFVIPVLIAAVMMLGAFIGYRALVGDRNDNVTEATSDEVSKMSLEELLIVVNDHKPLDENYVPKLTSFAGVPISTEIFADLDAMVSKAALDGVNLTVKTGYVSYKSQAKLYEETFEKIKKDNDYSEIRAESETKKICPDAGCSESQTGLLIRFSTNETDKSFEETEAAKWLERNSLNYGFILRYPLGREDTTAMTYDPRLYRYVGKENALNIRRYGMTLEEYYYHVFA